MAIATLVVVGQSSAQDMIGEITVRPTLVVDGDTIDARTEDGRLIRIRLADLDAPELPHRSKTGDIQPGQPGGHESTAALAQLLSKSEFATAVCYGGDVYRRHICTIYSNGMDVNQAMLEGGWAYLSTRWTDVHRWRSFVAAALARWNNRGVLAMYANQHPSDWRRDCWQNHICPNGVFR